MGLNISTNSTDIAKKIRENEILLKGTKDVLTDLSKSVINSDKRIVLTQSNTSKLAGSDLGARYKCVRQEFVMTNPETAGSDPRPEVKFYEVNCDNYSLSEKGSDVTPDFMNVCKTNDQFMYILDTKTVPSFAKKSIETNMYSNLTNVGGYIKVPCTTLYDYNSDKENIGANSNFYTNAADISSLINNGKIEGPGGSDASFNTFDINNIKARRDSMMNKYDFSMKEDKYSERRKNLKKFVDENKNFTENRVLMKNFYNSVPNNIAFGIDYPNLHNDNNVFDPTLSISTKPS